MKLRHQLMLAPWATTVTLLVAMAGAAWLLESQAGENHRLREVASRREQAADEARAAFSRQQAQLYRNMAIASSLVPAELSSVRARLGSDVDSATKGLSGVAQGLAHDLFDPQADALVKDLTKAAWRFAKAADNALDMASVDVNTGVAALQTADAEFAKTSQIINQLMRRVGELEQKAVREQRSHTLTLALGLGGTGMVLALGLLVLAWRVQRSVLADVQRVADAAGQVAQGRLDDINTGDRRNDEIGALLQAQASMVRQLRQMVQQVRGAARAIENSSAEVASGNMDLSQRTEQAAGSLQQSASSMEQLTGSVRQSADSAEQANQLAASASSVAQRGGQVVAQVVATMQGISDSSRRIGDIIGTIDGIAFQTNILALNAAVEAARAGEQGRGFAVVAAEVRSLAQRSAAAAREIKALISASVDNVDSGARLVRDAGGTMDEIVAAVQRVSATIGEITSAAQQQSGGIALVNNAVADLDQMTQRNAALVEQSAAAAESLREQAQRLTGVVGTFAWQE